MFVALLPITTAEKIDADNFVVVAVAVADTEQGRERLLPINMGQRIDANNAVAVFVTVADTDGR